MNEAARKMDSYTCPNGGTGVIQDGSLNVTICGQAAARSRDSILHEDGSSHSISDSKACLLINGKPAARLNDLSVQGGRISSGEEKVLIANGKPFIKIGDSGQVKIGKGVFFGVSIDCANPV